MGKKKIRAIKKALRDGARDPSLFSKEETHGLMSAFYNELLTHSLQKQAVKRKGFGPESERKTNIDFSELGENYGLYSESEQPEEPGES